MAACIIRPGSANPRHISDSTSREYDFRFWRMGHIFDDAPYSRLIATISAPAVLIRAMSGTITAVT